MSKAFELNESVLCDPATEESARLSMGKGQWGPAFSFVASVKMKGFVEPVKVFKPVQGSAAALSSSSLRRTKPVADESAAVAAAAPAPAYSTSSKAAAAAAANSETTADQENRPHNRSSAGGIGAPAGASPYPGAGDLGRAKALASSAPADAAAGVAVVRDVDAAGNSGAAAASPAATATATASATAGAATTAALGRDLTIGGIGGAVTINTSIPFQQPHASATGASAGGVPSGGSAKDSALCHPGFLSPRRLKAMMSPKMRAQHGGFDDEVCFGRAEAKAFIGNRFNAFAKNIVDPFILVQGEEGMGKSNLLLWARSEVKRNPAYADVRVMGGTCSRTTSRLSYGHSAAAGLLADKADARRPIAYDAGMRGFLCDLFALGRHGDWDDDRIVNEHVRILTELVDGLQALVFDLPDASPPAFERRAMGGAEHEEHSDMRHVLGPTDGSSGYGGRRSSNGKLKSTPRSRICSVDLRPWRDKDREELLLRGDEVSGATAAGNIKVAGRRKSSTHTETRRNSLPTGVSLKHLLDHAKAAEANSASNLLGGRRRSSGGDADDGAEAPGHDAVKELRTFVSGLYAQEDQATGEPDPIKGGAPLGGRRRSAKSTASATSAVSASSDAYVLGRLGSMDSIGAPPSLCSSSSSSSSSSSDDEDDRDSISSSSSSSSSNSSGSGLGCDAGADDSAYKDGAYEDDSAYDELEKAFHTYAANAKGNSSSNPDLNTHSRSLALSGGEAVPASSSSSSNNGRARGRMLAGMASSSSQRSKRSAGKVKSGLRGLRRRMSRDKSPDTRASSSNGSSSSPDLDPKYMRRRSSQGSSVSGGSNNSQHHHHHHHHHHSHNHHNHHHHHNHHQQLHSRPSEDDDASLASLLAGDEDELHEVRSQRLALNFREALPAVWSKLGSNAESLLEVFLFSRAEILAKGFYAILAPSGSAATAAAGGGAGRSGAPDGGAMAGALAGKALDIAEVLCLVVMLALEQQAHKVCVTIDDLEWLDELGMMLLRTLVGRQCRGVMVLATIRSRDVARAQQRLGFSLTGSPFMYPYKLKPLGAAAIAELLAYDFGLTALPAALLDKVVQSTGGMPLWAIEYVRGLIAQKVVRRGERDGDWTFDEDLSSLEVFSAGLEGAILQRFDNLKEETWKETFQWACVLQSDFTVTAIRDLMLFAEVQDSIEELVALQHVEQLDVAVEGEGSSADAERLERLGLDSRQYRVTNEFHFNTLAAELTSVMNCLRSVGSGPFTAHDVASARAAQQQDGQLAELQAVVDELVREGFLAIVQDASKASGGSSRESEALYAVAHDYYNRAVYDQIPPGEVRRLHLQTAQCLSFHGLDNEYLAPLLAHHYRKAGDQRNTVRCLFKAAKLSFKHDQMLQARSFLVEASQLADALGGATGAAGTNSALVGSDLGQLDAGEVSAIKLVLADVLLYLGCHEEATEVLEQLSALLAPPQLLSAGGAGRDECEGAGGGAGGGAGLGASSPPEGMVGNHGHLALTPPRAPPSSNAEAKSLNGRASSFTMRLPRFGSSGGGGSTAAGSTWSREAGLADRNGAILPGALRKMRNRYNNNNSRVGSSRRSNSASNSTADSLPESWASESGSGPSVSHRSATHLGEASRKARSASAPEHFHASAKTTAYHRRRGSLDEAMAVSDALLELDDTGRDGGGGGGGGGSSNYNSGRRRPSLRRMYSSTSLFAALPGRFKSSKDQKPLHGDVQFLLDNAPWVRLQAMRATSNLFNLDNNAFVSQIKQVVTALLDSGLSKDGALVRLLVHVAHCISPRYSGDTTKASRHGALSVPAVEALVAELAKVATSFSFDEGLVAGLIYKVCALCSVSAAQWREAADLLDKATNKLRSSPLSGYSLLRKHLADCLLMSVDGALFKGNLVLAERLGKELAKHAREMGSPQLTVWAAAVAAVVRFRRFGLLVSLKDTAVLDDTSSGGAAAGAGGATAGVKAAGSTTAATARSASASSNMSSVPLTGDSRVAARRGSVDSHDHLGGALGGGVTNKHKDSNDNLAGMEDRLMKVDRALWAALRSWKAGDRNSPSYDMSEAVRHAALAWDVLLETGTTHALVWYLALVYEILFYAIVQVVKFQPSNSAAAAAASGGSATGAAAQRHSKTFSEETLHQLCKSFKRMSEHFAAARAPSLRCRGLLSVLCGRTAKAALCFRKAIKAAAKLGMDYEERINHFLLREHCADVLSRGEATADRMSLVSSGVSRGFPSALALTVHTWRTGQPADSAELHDVLLVQNESASPSRRSNIPSNGSQVAQALADHLSAATSASFSSSRLRRRSSRSSANHPSSGSASDTATGTASALHLPPKAPAPVASDAAPAHTRRASDTCAALQKIASFRHRTLSDAGNGDDP